MAITSNQETLKKHEVLVNPHPFSSALSKYWNSANAPISIFIFIAAFTIAVPGFSVLITPIGIALMFFNLKTPLKLPRKMPASSGQKIDPNKIKLGSDTELDKPTAISCLGVCRETGYQYWEDADTDKRHYSFIATTGSGKTFGLRFHILMSLIQGSGVIAVDGKGDISLPLDLIPLIKRFNREDDLRILNFKQGSKNVYSETGIPRTNTFNPLAKGTTSYIGELLKSLLSSDNEGAKGGDVFKQRAEAMCETLAGLATYRRDHFSFKIRPSSIAEMLELRGLCEVYSDENIPNRFKLALEIYFKTLPDFELSNAKKYANGMEFKGKMLEQHGYVAMQLQPALQILATQYGFIFDTDYPEIDMKDVVTNNRILLCLLPAMDQSAATLQNTGKIILAALKGMISGELGDKFQGNIKETLDKRACKSPAPFRVLLDECGYYAAIPNVEILPAQGRGLGFSFWFIGQTYTDYKKGGDTTAEILWGNTVNKIVGTASTGDDICEKFNSYLGEAEVLVRDKVEIEQGDFVTSQRKSDTISIAKRKRIEVSDLTRLNEGQFYQATKESLVSVRVGDPEIKSEDHVKEARYNQLVGLQDIPPNIKSQLKLSLQTAAKRCKEHLSDKKIPQVKLSLLPTLESVITERQTLLSKGISERINNPIAVWQIALFNQATDELNEKEDGFREKSSQILSGILNKQAQQPQEKQKTPPKKTWAQAAIEASQKASEYNDLHNTQQESSEPEEIESDSSPKEKETSTYETDKQYLDHLLSMGRLTQEKYNEKLANARSQLQQEEETLNQESDPGKVEQDPFGKYSLDSITVADISDDSESNRDYDSNTQENYPSQTTRKMSEKTTREVAKKVIESVNEAFDLDI